MTAGADLKPLSLRERGLGERPVNWRQHNIIKGPNATERGSMLLSTPTISRELSEAKLAPTG